MTASSLAMADRPMTARPAEQTASKATFFGADLLIECQFVAFALLLVMAVVVAGCSNRSESTGTPANTSPSYRQGYDQMTKNTRDIVAKVNAQGVQDSPAQVLGSGGENIASICDGNLQAMISGATLGNTPQLPNDFSSADFLRGCNDAGRALLASG